MSQQQRQSIFSSNAAAASNLVHKAFHSKSIVENLPLQIECMTCFENTLVLGVANGRILIYVITTNKTSAHKLDVELEKTIAATKKPVQQLEAIKKFGILIALFDSQLHVFDLERYSLKYSINKSKGCSLFATSLSEDQKVLRLCVVCKKRLQFYYCSSNANSQFMELVSDLELSDTPKSLEFTKSNLIVFSLRKDYYYYELPSTSSAVSTKQPEVQFSTGQRPLDPLCHKLHNEHFVLGHDENNTILYTPNGKPYLQYPIIWSSTPSEVCSVGPYLVAILPALNCIEIVSIEPNTKSLQLVEFAKDSSSLSAAQSTSSASTSSSVPSSFLAPLQAVANNVSTLTSGLAYGTQAGPAANVSTADRLKLLHSNGNSVFYVATQSNVWCLTPIKINEQLEHCIRSKNYELGLNLIGSQQKFNKIDKSPFAQSWLANTPIDQLSEKEKLPVLLPFFNLTVLYGEPDENLQRRLQNLNALDLFCKKRFTESYQLFQSMKTDPSHLIAFLPGLLPEGYRARLKFEEYYPDFNTKELEDAIAGLIDYLQFKRNEILKEGKPLNDPTGFSLVPLIDDRPVLKSRTQLLQIIDTTLLKCYLKTKESLVQFFLRREQTFLHLEESERLLQQHNKISELIILYEKKEEHERALNLLTTESTKTSSNLFGLKAIVKYLKKIGNKNLNLIFKYAKNVIESDSELGMQIFMDNTMDMDNILAKRVQQKEQMMMKNRKTLTNFSNVLSSNERRASQNSNKFSGLLGTSGLDGKDDQRPAIRKKDSVFGGDNRMIRSSSNASFQSNANNPELIIDEYEEIQKSLDHETVCRFLSQEIQPTSLSVNLVRIYLQHCIFVWNDTNANLNNMLIDTYISFIESNDENDGSGGKLASQLTQSSPSYKTYKQMLTYFLNDTNNYEPTYALSKLDLDNYAEQRAIVLGKLGKHNEALSIYVNILNDTEKAETYCDDVYLQPNITDSKQVYYQLLQIYLNSDYEEIRIGASIRLLNAHSDEIGSCRTLELLPADLMKCKNLSPFFENMLNRLVRNRHNTQILNRLMFALELQIHETKIMCQDKKFIVNDEQICIECNKRMGKSAMVRFPNGRLIHYGCSKNSYSGSSKEMSND